MSRTYNRLLLLPVLIHSITYIALCGVNVTTETLQTQALRQVRTEIYLVNEETSAILESVRIFRFMKLTSKITVEVSTGNLY
jgi:hypothetical protein